LSETAPAAEIAANEAEAAPADEAPAEEAPAEPTAEPAPEATIAPPAAPSAVPTAEPTPEAAVSPSAAPTGEAPAEPSPEPSVEPSLEPSIEPSIGPSVSPEAGEMPMDGIMLLAIADVDAVVDAWLAEMAEEEYTHEFDEAFWLYKKLISSVKADSSKNAAQTAEAALVGGKAGSLGFALAYEALLDAAGIASDILTERSDDSIAWNVVRINDKWTHVDAFHDARSSSTGECFGLTDSAMARYHNWVRKSYSCTSTESNYYSREKDYIPCGDFETLFDRLYNAVQARSTRLKFYWFGEEGDVNITRATLVLSSIASSVDVSGSEDGCYCVLELTYYYFRWGKKRRMGT